MGSHVEVVPKYSVEHVTDGGKETVAVAVALPGVTDSSAIRCIVEDFICKVHVPGRYRVDIALNWAVEPKAEQVRFIKKKAVLKCVLRVKEGWHQRRAADAPGGCGSSSSNDENPELVRDDGMPVPRPAPAANGYASPQPARAKPKQQAPQAQAQEQAAATAGPQPEDVYAQAKLQANRDTAEDCERLARMAERDGDLERAVRMLQKASQLFPGEKYERALGEATWKLAASEAAAGSGSPGASPSSSAGGGSSSSAGDTAGEGPGGATSSGASSAGRGPHGSRSCGIERGQQQQWEEQEQRWEEGRQRWAQQEEQQRQQRGPTVPNAFREQFNASQQQRRQRLALGNTLPLVVGLALMAGAAYCMLPTSITQQPGLSQEAAALLEAAPAAATAAAALAMGAGTSSRGAAAAAAAGGAAGRQEQLGVVPLQPAGEGHLPGASQVVPPAAAGATGEHLEGSFRATATVAEEEPLPGPFRLQPPAAAVGEGEQWRGPLAAPAPPAAAWEPTQGAEAEGGEALPGSVRAALLGTLEASRRCAEVNIQQEAAAPTLTAEELSASQEWLPGPITAAVLAMLDASRASCGSAEEAAAAGGGRPGEEREGKGEGEADQGGAAGSAARGPVSSWLNSWLPAKTAAVLGPPWALVGWVWRVVSWLPRVLLWEPSWQAAATWSVFVGGLFLFLPPALALAGTFRLQDQIEAWTGASFVMAWQPWVWLAAGGGMPAVIATALERISPIFDWWRARPLSFLVFYPFITLLAQMPLRWLCDGVVLLLTYLVWSPRWWTHIPLTLAGVAFTARQPELDLGGHLIMQLSLLVAQWWLTGGGWLSVAGTACLLSYVLFKMVELDGVDFGVLASPLRLLKWVPVSLIAARFVWDWSKSLWMATPLAITLLGLVAVWQANPGGASAAGGGSRRFKFFGGGAGRWKGAGGIPAHLPELEVPAGAPEVVARVLSSTNYYEVLGVERDADEAAIRRAKRALSLSTHPDKIGNQPGVNEAFNLVTEAAEALGDPSRRQDYEAELTRLEFESRCGAEAAGGGIFGGGVGGVGGGGRGDQDGEEFMGIGIQVPCGNCGGTHSMTPVLRSPEAARFCAECNTRHPVRPGEIWIERSSAGWFSYQLRMFCCWDSLVFDITETAKCEGFLEASHQRRFPYNSHVNPLGRTMSARMGAGGGGGGGRGPAQQPASSGSGGRSRRKKGRRR